MYPYKLWPSRIPPFQRTASFLSESSGNHSDVPLAPQFTVNAQTPDAKE